MKVKWDSMYKGLEQCLAHIKHQIIRFCGGGIGHENRRQNKRIWSTVYPFTLLPCWVGPLKVFPIKTHIVKFYSASNTELYNLLQIWAWI